MLERDLHHDHDRCYRAVTSRDARFDGRFIVGVLTTGIYCRPSCPTPVQPRSHNCRFFPTAAAAQAAGLRACKRCLPDASPGSPEWDVRADLAARAMRLISDGVVDREGVRGVADRLAVSERHLHRIVTAELGATPIQLARSQRAQTARTLIETTDLAFGEIAFAAGFSSIRQFNDTVREVFALAPTELRRRARRRARPAPAGAIPLRLAYRRPFEPDALLGWLAARAVAGVEEVANGTYRRTLSLPGGPATVSLTPVDGHVEAVVRLTSLSDLAAAVARCRRLLDLDADPLAVASDLGRDAALAPLVATRPGLRVPGAADGAELAFRAVLGQQVSVAAARQLAGTLVTTFGTPIDEPDGALTHTFPSAATIAGADLGAVGMPASRRRTLGALAEALASDDIRLEPGADRGEVVDRLLTLPGIGPWTATYVAMRALKDPDAFPASDLGLRRAAAALGLPDDPRGLDAWSRSWGPWRAYAAQHLWTHDPTPTSARAPEPTPAAAAVA